jgi:hypothetical protein
MLLLGLSGLLPAAPAQAGFCASGATCSFDLDNTNVLGVDIVIRVTVNNTGATSVLTVNWISDNLANTPLGIDQFGFNSTASTTVLPAGWSNAGCKPPPGPPTPGCQMDGFGRFASEIDSPGGTDLSFSFTLGSLVTTFADNTQGGEFAAHIRYSGNCSGFVSDGTSKGASKDTNCTIEGIGKVPEPGTLVLLGIAMLGLGIVSRRMRTLPRTV